MRHIGSGKFTSGLQARDSGEPAVPVNRRSSSNSVIQTMAGREGPTHRDRLNSGKSWDQDFGLSARVR